MDKNSNQFQHEWIEQRRWIFFIPLDEQYNYYGADAINQLGTQIQNWVREEDE